MTFYPGDGIARLGGLANAAKQKQHRLLTRALVQDLNRVQTIGPDKGRRQVDRIARALVREAIDGNVPAAKLIFDRVEGAVSQALDVRSHNVTETITSANSPLPPTT